ncbi:peptidoglycan bridge formation glycyltransferase FemA/FemB family protein [Geomicrobium halophilum]
MLMRGGRRPYQGVPPTPRSDQDSESLIIKLEYFGQLLATVGESLQFLGASIAFRELQQEQVQEQLQSDNAEIPLTLGLDEANNNPNPDSHSISGLQEQVETLQQQITELERRIQDGGS